MFFYSLYSSSFFLRLFLSCVVLCSVLSIVDDSFSVSATAYCRLLARSPLLFPSVFISYYVSRHINFFSAGKNCLDPTRLKFYLPLTASLIKFEILERGMSTPSSLTLPVSSQEITSGHAFKAYCITRTRTR